MEIFFNQEDRQEINEDPGGDTSLYFLDPEVNFLGSVEERKKSYASFNRSSRSSPQSKVCYVSVNE